MKKGDIMAGLDGYSSAWSLGLYVGGSRDSEVKEDTEKVSSDPYEQAMRQEREQKRQIRENPAVRAEYEYEIERLKRYIKGVERNLDILRTHNMEFEYYEMCSRLRAQLNHLEAVLHTKEKLLHDALNMQ